MVSEGTFTASSTNSFIQLAVHSPTHISFDSLYLAVLPPPLIELRAVAADADADGDEEEEEEQMAWRRD